LITCVLFLPAYTGFRLAAERSDTNVDLLFVTTLRPRAIIWGKFVAAALIAVLIFSACTPFMVFTYLLRGIEAPAILVVVGIDFLVVLALVQLAIFFAVIPANLVVKGLLGVVALGTLVLAISATLSGTFFLVYTGASGILETRRGGVPFACMVGLGLAAMSLLYSWSVALISPPSANRALGMRLTMLGVWLATGVLFGISQLLLPDEQVPLKTWLCSVAVLVFLQICIAINEREQWTPRVARTIPRRGWLRLPAFLLYSGAAGGLLFALVLCGLTWLVLEGWQAFYLDQGLGHARDGNVVIWEWAEFRIVALSLLYTYCYALAAVFLRRMLGRRTTHTWVIMAILLGLGSAIPAVISLLLFRDFGSGRHDYVLYPNPFWAAYAIGTRQLRDSFFLGMGVVAGIVTLLNAGWLVRQIRAFRPHRRQPTSLEPPPIWPEQLDVTKTAG
jgi:hypothetical protein